MCGGGDCNALLLMLSAMINSVESVVLRFAPGVMLQLCNLTLSRLFRAMQLAAAASAPTDCQSVKVMSGSLHRGEPIC